MAMKNHLQPDTLLNGKYRIVRFIKSGGFGCTYEAENTYFDERVAIKEFFVKDFCNRDRETAHIIVGTESKIGLVERLKQKFLEEAKALYKLKHPGIVHVSDVFEENGTAYYVMDYIDGCSLDVHVRENGHLSEEVALGYIRQVCDALKYVHSLNRLHLDLKPGNMMLTKDESKVILIDFGTAKQYDECSGENTSTLLGSTPGYAPLEQSNTKITQFFPATDIYALGATLYKLLTGITPLTANERGSGEELAPVPSTVSDATRNAIEQALRLQKMNRPQSIDEFLTLLDAPAQLTDDDTSVVQESVAETVSAEELPCEEENTVLENTSPAPAPKAPSPKKKSRRWLWWILVAVIVLVGIFAKGDEQEKPEEPKFLAPANCHIVSSSGSYEFKAVKGESKASVGDVESVTVLWESFGTSETPNVGDLIKSVDYQDGWVTFETADTFREGNAVIAAKDAYGTILWSWHIWLTDQPQGQVYYNNAGTMMDRNLGATSATPGDVGALGLLYQWGRKDPFLSSSSISSNPTAKSTITWPSAVESNSSTGTIAYATANPTTFIKCNSNNYDWYYTGLPSTDNTRWTESGSPKSIYDPCPAGWRVPDGGSNGVWSKALGSSSHFAYTYNSTNYGMNFSGEFGSASSIWYPASGYRDSFDGGLGSVGNSGRYWSASPKSYYACLLYFDYNGYVYPSDYYNRALGLSVRCLQE